MPVSYSEPYNEAAAAEKIKQLESEQEQNEQKLSDATEQVKVELLRLDATSPDIAMQFKELLRKYFRSSTFLWPTFSRTFFLNTALWP